MIMNITKIIRDDVKRVEYPTIYKATSLVRSGFQRRWRTNQNTNS
jgi:hypothetical protein